MPKTFHGVEVVVCPEYHGSLYQGGVYTVEGDLRVNLIRSCLKASSDPHNLVVLGVSVDAQQHTLGRDHHLFAAYLQDLICKKSKMKKVKVTPRMIQLSGSTSKHNLDVIGQSKCANLCFLTVGNLSHPIQFSRITPADIENQMREALSDRTGFAIHINYNNTSKAYEFRIISNNPSEDGVELGEVRRSHVLKRGKIEKPSTGEGAYVKSKTSSRTRKIHHETVNA